MRIFIFALFLGAFAATAKAQSTSPTYKMEGLASLMNNYVDYGLTHTNKDPALQGSFWFNWGPQFRLGLWGSNVSFQESQSHFLLKLNADLKINFSDNTNMVLKFSDNHYFKAEGRDGNVLGLHLNIYGYGIRYEMLSNFFGSSTSATAYSFAKSWDVLQTWKWENTAGYVMVKNAAWSNYFFIESLLGTRPGSIYYQLGLSYNSTASQFSGAGDLAILLKASVGF